MLWKKTLAICFYEWQCRDIQDAWHSNMVLDNQSSSRVLCHLSTVQVHIISYATILSISPPKLELEEAVGKSLKASQ